MRKILLHLVILLILVLHCHAIASQTPTDSILQRIAYYEEVDSFDGYYQNIQKLYTSYYKNQQTDSLVLVQDYFYVDAKTAIDSSKLRAVLGRYAFYFQKRTGNIFEANKLYLKAHKLGETGKEIDKNVFYIENVLANNYARLNDYDKSLHYNIMVLRSLKQQNDLKRASRKYSDIGDNYKWIGDTISASKYYQEGIQLSQKISYQEGLLTNYISYIDLCIDKRRHAQAEDFINECREHINRLGTDDRIQAKLLDLLSLQAKLYSFTDKDLSISIYRDILSRTTKNNKSTIDRESGKIALKIAREFLEIEQYDSVQHYISLGLSQTTSSDAENGKVEREDLPLENTVVDLLEVRATTNLAKYNSTFDIEFLLQAKQDLDNAIYVNDLLFLNLIFTESQEKTLATNRALIEKMIAVLYLLHKVDLKPFNYGDVLRYFDKSKNILVRRNQSREIEDGLLADVQKIEYNLRYLQANRQLDEETRALQIRKNYLELDRLYSSSAESVKIKSEFEDYINYLWTEEDGLYYLAYIEGQYIFKRVEEKSLSRQVVRNIIDKITSRTNVKRDLDLLRLSEVLLPTDIWLLDEIDIVPDGILCLFPFDILVKGDQYLIENVMVNIRLDFAGIEREPFSLDNVLVVAPHYQNLPASADYENLDRAAAYQLHHVDEEIESIMAVAKNVEVMREVSLEEVIKYSGGNNVLHYAGHAKSDDKRAYLLLSDSINTREVDLERLDHWTNTFDLVVLSACETGIGTLVSGEGVQSLASSFLNNGTNSVMYTLWNANDVTTADLVGRFYGNLSKGMPLNHALRKSKLDFLEHASPEKRLPFFWASLTVVSAEFSANSPISMPILAIVFFTVLILCYATHSHFNFFTPK